MTGAPVKPEEDQLQRLTGRLERYQGLLEVTRLLSEQTDLDGLLETIVGHTTRIVHVERTTLYIYDEQNKKLWSRVAEGLGEKVITIDLDHGLVGAAARSREVVRVDDAYRDERFDTSFDLETGFQTRSVLCVPVMYPDGRLLGVLQTINHRDGVFDDEDCSVLGALASQISVAITRARLIERRLEYNAMVQSLKAAQDVQVSMLPNLHNPELEMSKFSLWGQMRPAQLVGGDFFDVFRNFDGRVALVLGDVSGKGMPAAVFMARTMTLLRAYGRFEPEPARVLELVNAELAAENSGGMFVTAFLGFFNPNNGQLHYANAGHEVPLLLQGRGRIEESDCEREPPLGAMEGMEYTTLSAEISEGLMVYSDGVTDAMNVAEDMFGEDRLYQELNRLPGNARQACENLVAAVDEFSGGAEQTDDITVLAVLRK